MLNYDFKIVHIALQSPRLALKSSKLKARTCRLNLGDGRHLRSSVRILCSRSIENSLCSYRPSSVSGKRCGFPGAPAHSIVEFSTPTVEPGTVARYTCDRGFELLGPARRMCNTNGTWVPQGIPFCGKLLIHYTFQTWPLKGFSSSFKK